MGQLQSGIRSYGRLVRKQGHRRSHLHGGDEKGGVEEPLAAGGSVTIVED